MTPPLTRTPSITSSASALSYLLSHHSDDDLLYGEHEIVEREEYELPSSLAWSSSSPSSPSSNVTPSLVSSSEPSPGPTLLLASSSLTPTPPPSSPTPSTSSSSTACPIESPSFSVLHDMLANLREQMNALWEGQSSTCQMLDELWQSRPIPQDNAEVLECLDTIESLLQRVIERTELVTERHTTETVLERETRRPGWSPFRNPRWMQTACFVDGPIYCTDLTTRASMLLHHDMSAHLWTNNCWNYSALPPHNAQLEFNHPRH
ncbi:hypothetical protein SCLCIDRAFT_26186 [Scleroderma citrinum Foug A]|uniref:Uncharacterized protein n=1 Tax=Scleroderma citrinum Foug A TaxID=1036808 RepID=A0A0C3DK13_9AGAM|nr:hypothetical protein SCLCIDRAFT_26186 [Scleroderma citrinum Foug A]